MRDVRRYFGRSALLLGAAVVLTTTGCTKPLLSPNETRSPFERYDTVRNQAAPQYIEDEYGRRIANIRGRLTPR